MTTVIASWRIKTNGIENVLDWMPALVSATCKEPGCIRYEFYQSPTDPANVLLFEQYKDDEALAAHRSTPHFQEFVLQRIVPLLETRAVQVFHDLPA